MDQKSLLANVAGILLLLNVTGYSNKIEAQSGYCDRDCLKSFVDQYLEALVAHDPSLIPLAKTVKFTENGQTLKPGDGMWGCASGLGSYKLYFTDLEAGQIGFFGVVEESGHPQILALRLKIENMQISEIETIVARKLHGTMAEPEKLVDQPIFNETKFIFRRARTSNRYTYPFRPELHTD